MNDKGDPYNWIKRDKHRRLFQEFKWLYESKWRDSYRICMCSKSEHVGHFAVEASVEVEKYDLTVQVVFPSNYPEDNPDVYFVSLKERISGELLIDSVINDPRFLSFLDGSLLLELPPDGSVSAVMVIDRVEEWLDRYLNYSAIDGIGR